MDVKSLAENDEQEVVREVHEFFADFVSIGQHVFSMNLPNCSEVFKSIFFPIKVLLRVFNHFFQLN